MEKKNKKSSKRKRIRVVQSKLMKGEIIKEMFEHFGIEVVDAGENILKLNKRRYKQQNK